MLKKPVILQIDVALNIGSTGRIVHEIGDAILKEGWMSHAAFGRYSASSTSTAHKIGTKIDQAAHWLLTRLFDLHGKGSLGATKKLRTLLTDLKPDVVHLHQVHGYYLHIRELMRILQEYNKPVVWTFHDAWQLTGHCCVFERFNCQKWQNTCGSCPMTRYYPQSWGIDNSKNNHQEKKVAIGALEKLTIVPVSYWLGDMVKQSYLSLKPIQVIHNGVDLEKFFIERTDKAAQVKEQKINYLGVAGVWADNKGLSDFVQMSELLRDDEQIVLIGLTEKQHKGLPRNIKALPAQGSIAALRQWYNRATVFLNPSRSESFGLVTAEALACGTPAVVYNTTACPELVDENTGRIVAKGDFVGMLAAARELAQIDMELIQVACRKRAEMHFNKQKQTSKYIELYKQLIY
jgi:putative colanic acid biosynthesis glycosyltransferase